MGATVMSSDWRKTGDRRRYYGFIESEEPGKTFDTSFKYVKLWRRGCVQR